MGKTIVAALIIAILYISGVTRGLADEVDGCQSVNNPEKMIHSCRTLLDGSKFSSDEINLIIALNNYYYSVVVTESKDSFNMDVYSELEKFKHKHWDSLQKIIRSAGNSDGDNIESILASYWYYNRDVSNYMQERENYWNPEYAQKSTDAFELNGEAYLLRSIAHENRDRIFGKTDSLEENPKVLRNKYAARKLGAGSIKHKFLKFYLGEEIEVWDNFLRAAENARPEFQAAMQSYDLNQMTPEERAVEVTKKLVEDARSTSNDVFSNLNDDIAPAMRLIYEGQFEAAKIALSEEVNDSFSVITALWLNSAPSQEVRGLVQGASDAYRQLYEHDKALGMIAAYAVTKADTVGLCGDVPTIFSVTTTITTSYRNAYGKTAPDTVRTIEGNDLIVARKFADVVERTNMTEAPWIYVQGFEKFIKAAGGCESSMLSSLEENMKVFAASN